jgi:endonuclease/exonuclease/phosphatase family metal-dependent hydrolase
MNKVCLLMIFLCLNLQTIGQNQNEALWTIAFYNLENLFHPSDDPNTFDDDRTPSGKDHWTYQRYHKKLANMAKVIRGLDSQGPSIIGLCELENRTVLQDLMHQEQLKDLDYGMIHFDSPDLRGVDVALLYRKSQFRPLSSQSIEVPLFDHQTNKRIWTRDQLLVYGELFGNPLYIMVNHWPSRSGGKQRSAPNRQVAARVSKRLADSILRLNPSAQLIVMGDFNDNPDDTSLKMLLQNPRLINPMQRIHEKGHGSLAFRDTWFLFDQMILSRNFTSNERGLTSSSSGSLKLRKVGIHAPYYLKTPDGRFKGYPFRSMQGGRFTGGYSDHFPVYIQLTKVLN